ncbi:MAG TPA: LytTR family DNA-binding domain-containing protein [Chitinophagales bacterium]|nr:LytTR family DNA-binding domain-containing protein [Chitinophagales bacterium]
MISAVIIDDEKAGIENLGNLLARYCPDVSIAGTAGNITTGKEIIDDTEPELVFLDIEMPFGNGFDLLAGYSTIPFEVIFVTAFEKYAIKAIRLSACDYILKPIEIAELKAAVERAAGRISQKSDRLPLKTLLANIKELGRDKKIGLPTQQGLTFVNEADIVRCEADGSYTWFYFTNRDKLLVTRNLGEYEELLADDGFIRVHHAHLINRQHITELIRANAPVLVMSDGSQITVSQRRRDALLKLLNERG